MATSQKEKQKGEAKKLLALIPRFVGLLVNLLKDPRVSKADKAILGATIAYVLNPVDLVPDWVPFFGLVDDAYLIALSIFRLMLRTDPSVLMENWHGPEDVLKTVRKTADLMVFFLPSKVRRALLGKVTFNNGGQVNEYS